MKKVLVVVIALFCLVGYTNAQKMTISVQPAVSLPMGDAGDVYKTGFGGLATFQLNVGPSLGLIATTGYLTHVTKFFSDLNYNYIPALVGARFTVSNPIAQPYIQAQAGMYFESFSTKVNGTTYSTTSNDFGFMAGAGVIIKVTPKFDVDLSASYHSISTTGTSSTFIIIGAGINFALN